MSLDPRENVVDRMERRVFLGRRPINDDHLDAQRAGCLYLRLGRRAAAVLGDERVDPLIAHQGDLVLDAERSARKDQAVERQRHCQGGRSYARGNGVAAPARIPPVARRRWSGTRGAAGHQARGPLLRYRPHSSSDHRSVAPGRPGKSCDGNPHLPAGRDGVSRNLDSERVRRVDNRADFPLDQIGLEPVHAAEAANTEGYRWRQWISRPAGEGQHRLKVPAVDDPLGQRGCLRRAAKDQKPHLSALRRFTR